MVLPRQDISNPVSFHYFRRLANCIRCANHFVFTCCLTKCILTHIHSARMFQVSKMSGYYKSIGDYVFMFIMSQLKDLIKEHEGHER